MKDQSAWPSLDGKCRQGAANKRAAVLKRRAPGRLRIVAAATMTAAAIVTTSCAPSQAPRAAGPTGSRAKSSGIGTIPSLSGKTIAVIQSADVPYYTGSAEGAVAAVKALNGNAVIYDSHADQQTELNNVRTAIAQGVNGILLFSLTQASLTTEARLAAAAHIPVVDYYGWVPGLNPKMAGMWVGANATQAGVLDGKAMASLVPAGSDVAIVQGQLGRGEVEEYTKGFKSQLVAASIHVVAEPSSNWLRSTALAEAKQIAVQYSQVKAIYCENDDTTVGCVQGLRELGKTPGQVKLVTLNGSPLGTSLIQQGWLQADVAWSPVLESAIAVRGIAQILGGQKIAFPVPCKTPMALVTARSPLPWYESWAVSTAQVRKDLMVPCSNQTSGSAFAH